MISLELRIKLTDQFIYGCIFATGTAPAFASRSRLRTPNGTCRQNIIFRQHDAVAAFRAVGIPFSLRIIRTLEGVDLIGVVIKTGAKRLTDRSVRIQNRNPYGVRLAPVNNDHFPGGLITVLHLRSQRAVLGLLGFARLATLGIIDNDLKSFPIGIGRPGLIENTHIRLNIIPVIILDISMTQNHRQVAYIIGICQDRKVFNVGGDNTGTQLKRGIRRGKSDRGLIFGSGNGHGTEDLGIIGPGGRAGEDIAAIIQNNIALF